MPDERLRSRADIAEMLRHHEQALEARLDEADSEVFSGRDMANLTCELLRWVLMLPNTSLLFDEMLKGMRILDQQSNRSQRSQ